MAISDWPVGERPREKLLSRGSAALSDAELLAIFIRTGTPGKTAVDLARELLHVFGGLRQLMQADRSAFCAIPGLGRAKFIQLQAVIELGRRLLAERMQRGNPVSSPQDARNFLLAQLQDRQYEVFCCVYLDNRHRVIDFEELFRGSINGASVHPREVVKNSLARNAAALLIAHNHPSGVAEPSNADRLLTQRLYDALALVDIRLLDHIVVGDGELVSFKERGIL